MNIVIVGLGGIGSNLVSHLCQYLEYDKISDNSFVTVMLVDGDTYSVSNMTRQETNGISGIGKNKADVTLERLKNKFSKVRFLSQSSYLTFENIDDIIINDSIIFLCVDNHATRNMVSEHCENLNNVVLISGGNELYTGNVQVYIRKDGQDVTASLTDYHKEILNFEDKNPADMSCEEMAVAGTPQMLFTNLSIATNMLWMFYYITQNIISENENIVGELYLDFYPKPAMLAKTRKPLKRR